MSDDDDHDLAELERALAFNVPSPSADRIAAVRSAALTAQRQGRHARVARIPTRRALLISTAAAAVGAAAGAVVANANRADAPSTSGPPTEALSFSSSEGVVTGSRVSGAVINHTWGVELLLDATGLDVGATYRVAYIPTDLDAGEVDAGGFVGATVPIHCRCNAPLLRTAIAAIEIRDAAGAVVSRADFT